MKILKVIQCVNENNINESCPSARKYFPILSPFSFYLIIPFKGEKHASTSIKSIYLYSSLSMEHTAASQNFPFSKADFLRIPSKINPAFSRHDLEAIFSGS